MLSIINKVLEWFKSLFWKVNPIEIPNIQNFYCHIIYINVIFVCDVSVGGDGVDAGWTAARRQNNFC